MVFQQNKVTLSIICVVHRCGVSIYQFRFILSFITPKSYKLWNIQKVHGYELASAGTRLLAQFFERLIFTLDQPICKT